MKINKEKTSSLNIVKITAKYRWCLQYPAYTEHGRVGEEEWGTVGLRGGQAEAYLSNEEGSRKEWIISDCHFWMKCRGLQCHNVGAGPRGYVVSSLYYVHWLGWAGGGLAPSPRWGCWPRGSAGGTSAGTRRTAARRPCASADTRSSCGRSGPACSGSCSGRWARSAPATRTT